jgi:adenine-specific DNA methylase
VKRRRRRKPIVILGDGDPCPRCGVPMPPQGNIELMSQEESAMTSRALLVKIKRDLEN